MKKFVYLFFLIPILGCEKETTEIYNYPSILAADELQVLTQVNVYTKEGQLNDNAVINGYLKREQSAGFYLNTTKHLPVAKPDTIIYQAKDTVVFPIPEDWSRRVPKQVGDYIYFYMPDTLLGFTNFQQEAPFSDIIRQIGLFKPYYEELTPGHHYQRVFSAFIAKGNANNLEFPQIIYMITRRRSNYYAGATGTIYGNAFDPNVTKLLGNGDTLAIQETKVVYRKINN